MLVDVPVVAVDPAGERPTAEFLVADSVYRADSIGELVSVLEKLVMGDRDPAVEQRVSTFMKQQFLSLDGNASCRAADLLLELANSPPNHSRISSD